MIQLRKLFSKELGRYLIVGIVAVLIDLASYHALIYYFKMSPHSSKRVSFMAGSVWSFIFNKYYTFRKKGASLSEPILFTLIYVSGFFLNSAIHDFIYGRVGQKTLSFSVATFISVVWNYLGQKFIVFSKHRFFDRS